MSPPSRLRDAIRRAAERAKEDASATVQFARVTDADDFTIELMESSVVLGDDEVEFSQWMRAYNRDTGVVSGDTVVVIRKPTGGEIHWVVVGVLADVEPSQPLTELPPPPDPPEVVTLPYQDVEPDAVPSAVVLFSELDVDTAVLKAKWEDGFVSVVDSRLLGP